MTVELSGHIICLDGREFLFLSLSEKVDAGALRKARAALEDAVGPDEDRGIVSLSCYIGISTDIFGLHGAVGLLKKARDNNVLLKGGVFGCERPYYRAKAVKVSDLSLWSALLKDEEYGRFLLSDAGL